MQVLFPPCLTTQQRAILHGIAAEHGLKHSSTGEGSERQIAICCSSDVPGVKQVCLQLKKYLL